MGFGLVFLRKLSAKNTNKLNVLMVEPIMQILLRIEMVQIIVILENE